jgi:preprotein translocase subunit YajC
MSIAILLLVQDAPPPPAQPGGFLENVLGGMFVPLALCFLVFWLMILRPESKNRKKRQEMLSNLQKGDEVITNGGLYGTVVQVKDGVVTLQVDEGVRLRFALQSIQSREEAGTPAPETTAKVKA